MKRRVRALLGVAGLSAVVATIAVSSSLSGAASGTETPPTTAFDRSVSAAISPSVLGASAKAVASVLPTGANINQQRSVVTASASYDLVSSSAADGSTYEFNVYHKFSAAELDGAGLTKSAVQGGTLWVGSDSPDMRSVYFLGSSGVGVWISNSSASRHAVSISTLESEAAQLASAVANTGATP